MLQRACTSLPSPGCCTGLHNFPQDTSTGKARLEFESVAIRAAQ